MTTQSLAPLGQVTVRLFEDGGVEMELDVDDAQLLDLLAVAGGGSDWIGARVREEHVPGACRVCGQVVSGV